MARAVLRLACRGPVVRLMARLGRRTEELSLCVACRLSSRPSAARRESRDPLARRRDSATAANSDGGINVGVDGPRRHRCARMRSLRSHTREPSMNEISRIGIDTSKNVFQLHGVDAVEQPVLRKKLRRRAVLPFFAKLAPTKIGLEACGGAHYWARELKALGHDPVLL